MITGFHIKFEDSPPPRSELWDMLSAKIEANLKVKGRYNLEIDSAFPHKKIPRELPKSGFKGDRNSIGNVFNDYHFRYIRITFNTLQYSARIIFDDYEPVEGRFVDPSTQGMLTIWFSPPLRFLTCDEIVHSNLEVNWSDLIDDYCNKYKVRFAAQYSQDYQSWQHSPKCLETPLNEPTPQHTQSEGSNVKLKIDVTKNPGGPVLHHGQIYKVAAEMWVNDSVWESLCCTKEQALAQDWWLETRNLGEVTYFKSWPHPFIRPDGEQGKQQARISKLFFNREVEWPPQSGSVSEVPCYGGEWTHHPSPFTKF